jgi:penicillin-binding protein 1A
MPAPPAVSLHLARARRAAGRAARGTRRTLETHPNLVWLASSAAAGLAAVWLVAAAFAGQPSTEALFTLGDTAQATVILDRDDAPAFTIFREQRLDVSLADVAPQLVQAILAIEDWRFLQHGGIDLRRVAGAAVSNLRQGRLAEGGSTLTQQLARQGFLGREKTVSRKLKEAVLALRIEQVYSKTEILELYLNRMYFGAGLYGVQAASLGYFGRPARELDLAQAALLAGLVQAPSAYAPTASPLRAVERRNVVLARMLEVGVIDQTAFEAARQAPLDLRSTLRAADVSADYFREAVRQELVERLGADLVYAGGLTVHTTLDLAMQRAAEVEVARALEDIEAGGDDDPLQAALVALDPRTGEVRAMVGGRDFSESPFNRVTQARRQPGSAFKPFVYAAALEQGVSPATLITGLDEPVQTRQGAWVPADDHDGADVLTMRAALRESSNRAAVRMLQHVGVARAVRQAEDLGLGSLPAVPSLALGTGEVSLLAMTRAFAAFANQGVLQVPTLIRRVVDADGRVLFEHSPEPTRGVSAATAFQISSMLGDVIDAGTAAQARALGFSRPAAGKTGTTDAYHDAWFVGYTPYLATGVWIGHDQPRPIAANGYASRLAVPLWARFMLDATRDDPAHTFTPPAGVVPVRICQLSGGRATGACAEHAATEYFVHGTEPLGYCPLHGRFGFWDRLFGRAPDPSPMDFGTPRADLALEPAPAPALTVMPAPQIGPAPGAAPAAIRPTPEPIREALPDGQRERRRPAPSTPGTLGR